MKPMKKGSKVTYVTANKREVGIVKSEHDNPNYLFVVFNCGGEWDKYEDYTAALTRTSDLIRGWHPHPTVGEITREYLEKNGYSGLIQPDAECGCSLDELNDCDENCMECIAGFKGAPSEDAFYADADYCIYTTKELADQSFEAFEQLKEKVKQEK